MATNKEIEDRLAQIAAAVAAKTQAQTAPAPVEAKNKAFACPIDPAERALCDSCQ